LDLETAFLTGLVYVPELEAYLPEIKSRVVGTEN
jgi:hypothetical protein